MTSTTRPFDAPSSEALTSELEFARRLALQFAGSGHELYLVGGAVRDALLGSPTLELDFATSATPAESAELLERFASRAPYRVGEKFGTIGCMVDDWTIEVTTYRSHEVYATGSRKPQVQFGRTIEEDLSRRDFTINAIALHPSTGDTIDPFGGAHDLRQGIVRAVGTPELRFREDPLRLLRAVRFASRYGFRIEPQTLHAMTGQAAALGSISRERVRDEYSEYLTGQRPSVALTLLRDTGLMAHSVPELTELTRMPDHGANHPLSLWDHTMRVVDRVEPTLGLRWAALLHDIAKPATRTKEPDGRTRFFHHEVRGAEVARNMLAGLRYPSAVIDAVSLLVETHMQIHAFSPEWSVGAVRRLCLRLGPLMHDAIELARADAAGHSLEGTSVHNPKYNQLEQRLQELNTDQVEQLRSPLSGDDLMRRYSRPPGPWIRAVKERLLDEVLEGRLHAEDRDGAWNLADEILADR